MQETAVSRLLNVPNIDQILNETDQHGNTPIMMAAKYATKGLIMLLLNNKDVNLEAVDNMNRDLCFMIRSVSDSKLVYKNCIKLLYSK